MAATGLGLAVWAGDDFSVDDLVDRPDTDTRSASALNDYLWGGGPAAPTQIPYAWLSQPLRFRPDAPINVADVGLTGGATSRSVNTASATEYGEFPSSLTILSSLCASDAGNLGAHLTGNYGNPRMRCPQLTLDLLRRTDVERWLILGRREGNRIQVTGTPGQRVVLNANSDFEVDLSGWSGQNGYSIARSSAWARQGTFSMLITPPGGVSDDGAVCAATPIQAGKVTIAAWLMSPGGWSNVRLDVDWYDSAGTLIPGEFTGPVALTAGVPAFYTRDVFPPSQAARFPRLRVIMGGTPTSADVLHVDLCTITGVPAGQAPWPEGTTNLIIEGIRHLIASNVRQVVWNTSPVVGSTAGTPGPWFRADSSFVDGTHKVPF